MKADDVVRAYIIAEIAASVVVFAFMVGVFVLAYFNGGAQ